MDSGGFLIIAGLLVWIGIILESIKNKVKTIDRTIYDSAQEINNSIQEIVQIAQDKFGPLPKF